MPAFQVTACWLAPLAILLGMLGGVPSAHAGRVWGGAVNSPPQSSPEAVCEINRAFAGPLVTLEGVKPIPTSPLIVTACPIKSYSCIGTKHWPPPTGDQNATIGGAVPECLSGELRCGERCLPPGLLCNECGPEPPPSTCTTKPVKIPTGEKLLFATDLRLGGATPLSIDRTYAAFAQQSGLFGNRWRTNIDRDIFIYNNNIGVFVVTADGTMIVMKPDTGGIFRPMAGLDRDVKAVHLTTPVEAWEYTDENDEVSRFEKIATLWKLVSIKQRNNYTQTLSYDASAVLQTLTDSFGRTLTFTMAVPPANAVGISPVITRIVAPGGLQIDYTYSRATSLSNLVYGSEILTTVVTSQSGATPETTTYHYETANRNLLTGFTDARGVRQLTVTYDGSFRVLTSEWAGGVDKSTFVYDDINKKVTVTNALGKTATYTYAFVSGGKRVTAIDGVASTNCPASNAATVYDTKGQITQTTDEEGRITKYILDTRGRPTSVTRGFNTPQAVTTTYAWDPNSRVQTQMVEPTLTTNYTWTNGLMTALSKVDTTTGTVPYASTGQTRTWTYAYTGAAGLLASVDGPLAGTGDTVSYTYDASGYVNTVTNEVALVTTVNTKNFRGQPTQITDPNGIISNLTYDMQGRLLTVTVNPGANQAVTTMTYDAVGQITKITKPDGSFFAYTYDNAMRLTTVTGQDGQTINYTRDLKGDITATNIKNAGGTIVFSQTQTFDELGRLLKNMGAAVAPQTTTYAYEKNDNLKTVTDPRGGLYSYAYDSLNRLIRETDQENSQVNTTLDGRDNVTTYADPRTLQTTYIRNGFGEVKRQTSPDSGTTDFVRDLRGLVTQKTDGRGVITNMTYDNASRILTKFFPAAAAENVTYTYDAITGGNFGKGRLTSMTHEGGSIGRTYDARGNITADARIIAASGAAPRTVTYATNASDLVTQITYPSGRQVAYTRDTMGRITLVQSRKISTDPWADIATGIVYQPMSRLVQSLFAGNGLSNWNTYTADYELDLSGVYDGATKLIERTHSRTDKLNLTNIWDNVVTANNQSFAANPANRLQNADGPWGSKTYFYDGVGNRTFENTTAGGVTTSDNFQYPATSNRVQSVVRATVTTRSLTYDGAGNIATDTRSGIPYVYAYNNANRLKTVTSQANLVGTYTYNGFEQLIGRAVTNSGTANGTTFFVHDLWGNVIAELNAAGNTVREYIWLPETEISPTRVSPAAVDRPVAVVSGVNTATPQVLFVHVDQLNRPVMMTNSTKANVWQAVWTPWGIPFSISGAETNDSRFPGQWFQLEAGLHYNWYRHYDPSLGRYTQPDPLEFIDGPSIYAYARSSPYGYVDRDGRVSAVLSGGGSAGPELWALCVANPLICGGAVAIGTGIAIACWANKADNDNTKPPPPPQAPTKTNCEKAYAMCIKARGGLFKAGFVCGQALKACRAGSTTIFGPGLVGSPE
jgi:RHS repeat-associated protein